MIASGPPNFIKIVCLKFFNFTFKTSYDKKNCNYQKVLGPMFDTELLLHSNYDSKSSTKFHEDCMFDIFNFTFKTSYDKKIFLNKY